jgi:hypothetical protein
MTDDKHKETQKPAHEKNQQPAQGTPPDPLGQPPGPSPMPNPPDHGGVIDRPGAGSPAQPIAPGGSPEHPTAPPPGGAPSHPTAPPAPAPHKK